MTQEEYRDQIQMLEFEITEAKDKMKKLRAEFLKENAKFREGDKVVLINDPTKHPFTHAILTEKRTEAFIDSVHDNSFSGKVQYKFKKVKKDGTRSSHELWQSYYSRIELIEPAKTDEQ